MSRIVDRFRAAGHELRLLAPGRSVDGELDAIGRFRAQVFREFSSLPQEENGTDAPSKADHEAWHLLACRETEIAGCIRFSVFEQRDAAHVPHQVLVNSQCQFTGTDREQCLELLSDYCVNWQTLGGPFTQVGGLAVSGQARGTPVGPILCLAGNAFMRLIGSNAGVVLAAEKTGGAGLYEKAGCFALSDADEPPRLLADSYHQDNVLLMGIAPRDNVPSLEPVILSLCGMLESQLDVPTQRTSNELNHSEPKRVPFRVQEGI